MNIDDDDPTTAAPPTLPDCPICLEVMEVADLRHPLQCHCGYNFCRSCLQSLISSSQDDYEMASDGSRRVKIFLHCPHCRSDLQTSVRDTLLLRRTDAAQAALQEEERNHKGTGNNNNNQAIATTTVTDPHLRFRIKATLQDDLVHEGSGHQRRILRQRLRHKAQVAKIQTKLVVLGLLLATSTISRTTTTVVQSWNPQDTHPCNIRTVSLDQLYAEFGDQGLPPLYHVPIVIRTSSAATSSSPEQKPRNAVLQAQTQRDTILSQFAPNFTITLSSSNAISEHRRTIPLHQYLEEIAATPETFPTQLSNETWYLFGETFDAPWQQLLASYVLPPCQTCQRERSALSFGIGNRGSGVQWHIHGPGFSESLHGRKKWILYPPNHREPARTHKDQSSRQWMEVEYVRARDDVNFYECTRTSILEVIFVVHTRV